MLIVKRLLIRGYLCAIREKPPSGAPSIKPSLSPEQARDRLPFSVPPLLPWPFISLQPGNQKIGCDAHASTSIAHKAAPFPAI